MTKSVETVERFFGLVCAGESVKRAAGLVGVSRTRASFWWRRSVPMGLEFHPGRLASPPAPVAASRSAPGSGSGRRVLTGEDRAVIGAGVRQGLSYQRIADLVGRSRSVVWREVKRNTGRDGVYWPSLADRVAAERRRRPKVFKLVAQPELCRRIEGWMDEGWSPKLISSVLALDHPPGSMGRVSHETIYQALYVQARGRLRADLHRQLSLKRTKRKPRGPRRQGKAIYAEAFTISQRPPDILDRAVPGHWEGDLVIGGTGSGSAVGTLVERMTRFTILLHLPDRHDADSVARAMIREMSKLPEHLRRSITWDRGTELARYRDIQLALDAPVYFCDPHSPWQRGTNENTNRLLRFWLEKGSDLSVHTPEDLRRIADTLNRRPRPTLDLETPAQRLSKYLAEAA